jgi:hypothetical protein
LLWWAALCYLVCYFSLAMQVLALEVVALLAELLALLPLEGL